MTPEVVEIGGSRVAPGERAEIDLRVARLPTGDWLSLPTVVLNGRLPGPSVWLDAAIHGDELNGLEIIRRVLGELDPERLSGKILAVPIVNVFGFVHQSRYLPDRRDLNRSFPGSARGSLAARIAQLFMKEIVGRCDYGLDFHTGSLHRANLPQIRAELDDPETRRLAETFGAPVLYPAAKIKGSLRAAARKRGIPMLVYEAGEPLRFDHEAIRIGVRGTLRIFDTLGMWEAAAEDPPPTFEAKSTRWLRAGRSGILRLETGLGDRVAEDQVLGTISDVLGTKDYSIKAPFKSVVIGFTNNPLVHQGDAMIHLAKGETTSR